MAKKKNKGQQIQQSLSPEQFIRQRARSLEIGPCYLTDDLTDMKEGYVIVTRRHTGGRVSLAMFLVDVYCLGVKDSFCRLRMDPDEFEDFINGIPRVRECTYNEAHNWVYGSIAFAEEAGIEPDKSFNLTQYMLEEDTDDIPLIEYEFGDNGKHHLFCQSNLEGSKYLPILREHLGNDFLYTTGLYDFDDDEAEDFGGAFDKEELQRRIEESPLFKEYGPATEYTYQHPEYPKELSEADRELERMIANPAEKKFINDKTIKELLSRPHDTLSAQLERIILYHIGQTCDGISEDYDKAGFSAIIPLSAALLGEVGNENSSLEVLLEILRQSQEFFDYHFADSATEDLLPSLYKLGRNRLDRLMEFIHEPGLYTFFKYIVFRTVTIIGIEQPERREEVIEWYREAVRFAAEVLSQAQYIDSTLAGFIAYDLIDLKAKELLPEIKQMYDTQLVDLRVCGDFKKVSRMIRDLNYDNFSDKYEFDIYKQIKEIRNSLSSLYPFI